MGAAGQAQCTPDVLSPASTKQSGVEHATCFRSLYRAGDRDFFVEN